MTPHCSSCLLTLSQHSLGSAVEGHTLDSQVWDPRPHSCLQTCRAYCRGQAAADTATSRNPCRPTSPGRVNCRLTWLQAETCEMAGTRGSRMCEPKRWGPSQSLGQSARDRHKCPGPVPLLATRAPASYFTAQPSKLQLAARETSSGSVASQDAFTSFRAVPHGNGFPQSSHHNFTAQKFFRCIRKPSQRLTRRGPA